MSPSEIDDIFASNGKAFTFIPAKASSSSSAIPDKKTKKKRDKEKSAKRKRDNSDAEDAVPSKLSKRQVPETVFDPSAVLCSIQKSMSSSSKADKFASGAKPRRPKKDREEEERFKDSRGSGPRRKTEEGFLIYKENELGIKDEGGDTPLCPFDCLCCF